MISRNLKYLDFTSFTLPTGNTTPPHLSRKAPKKPRKQKIAALKLSLHYATLGDRPWAAPQSHVAPSAGYSALCTSLLAPWPIIALVTFSIVLTPEGHYAKGLNTQETIGLSRGRSWLQASCEEFPRTEGSRFPPMERHSPPVSSQTSRVTMSWNAWSDPVGSLSPPQERTPGCLGAHLRPP